MNQTVKTFLKLVTIDSPSGHEHYVAAYLKKWLNKNAFEFKTDKVGNIYATNNKSGVPLLFCAHMDTVQPGIGIKPVIKNGVIKSSGTTILGADNKAALAAILTVIETTKPEKAIELLFTVKEETGGGIEFLPFKWIKSKKGLVFDSSKPLGGIVLCSPYICNFQVTFTGKAAHASLPEEGINALTPAVKALQQIKVGVLDNGATTVNIGLVNAGTGINVIPEKVNISGEVRSYDEKLFKKHIDTIKKIFEKEAENSGLKIKFVLDGFCTGYSHVKKGVLIAKIDGIYKSLGLNTVFYEYSGISDANVLVHNEMQAFNLTDGTKYAHTTNEEMSEQDLIMLTAIINKCIQTL